MSFNSNTSIKFSTIPNTLPVNGIIMNETSCFGTGIYNGFECCKKQEFNEYHISYRLLANMPINYQMRIQLVNHFLLVLSISDLFLLICNFFFLIFPVCATMINDPLLNYTYPSILRYGYPLALTAQTCGVYMTVLVSVHRFMGVCYPFRAKRYVNITPVRIAIISAIAFSFGVNIPTWGELYVDFCIEPFQETVLFSRQIKLSTYMENPYYKLFYKVICYTLTMFILPFGTLIFVNSKIIMALKKSNNLRSKHGLKNESVKSDPAKYQSQFKLLKNMKYSDVLNSLNIRSNTNGFKLPRSFLKTQFTNSVRDRSVTLMLLAIVAMFLGCNGLAFCNNFVEILVDMSGDMGKMREETFAKSVEISNILISLNSASSIVIYIIFSSKFRHTLKIYFGLAKRPESVAKRPNVVAITTALACQRALELSIIPNEIDSNHDANKNTQTNNPKNNNEIKQQKKEIINKKNELKNCEIEDDEKKALLDVVSDENNLSYLKNLNDKNNKRMPVNSISQYTEVTNAEAD
ncbi:FMRFamide receptor [Strongyloides ratti]|uniref:FMRFamide receptor n=1 Tax=Strongyloides ratti TaxID=34506 RepID=A0A090MWU6_STRRB|nr:FMRFamide receptor [Strongyloides ratti]CEF64299.1 FMRFamide receptor [Strongyloides ratti]